MRTPDEDIRWWIFKCACNGVMLQVAANLLVWTRFGELPVFDVLQSPIYSRSHWYESALFPLIDYLEIRKHKMSFYPYLLLIKCLLAQLIYRHTLTDTSLYHICAFTTECSPIHVVLRNDSMTLAYVLNPVMCTCFTEHQYKPFEGLTLGSGNSVERPVKPLIQPRRP
jgi:hypothetical protein